MLRYGWQGTTVEFPKWEVLESLTSYWNSVLLMLGVSRDHPLEISELVHADPGTKLTQHRSSPLPSLRLISRSKSLMEHAPATSQALDSHNVLFLLSLPWWWRVMGNYFIKGLMVPIPSLTGHWTWRNLCPLLGSPSCCEMSTCYPHFLRS